MFFFIFMFIEILKIDLGDREKHYLWLHLFTYSLADSCMCSDRGLNLQPWLVRMML